MSENVYDDDDYDDGDDEDDLFRCEQCGDDLVCVDNVCMCQNSECLWIIDLGEETAILNEDFEEWVS